MYAIIDMMGTHSRTEKQWRALYRTVICHRSLLASTGSLGPVLFAVPSLHFSYLSPTCWQWKNILSFGKSCAMKDSEHDAYWARMIAEGKEKKTCRTVRPVSCLNPTHSRVQYLKWHCTLLTIIISSNNMYMVGFLLAEDSDFVVGRKSQWRELKLDWMNSLL